MTQPAQTTLDDAIAWGLTPQEWQRILQLLGRTPNPTELALFGVMWSEHCCYKNSLYWLKTLPREGKAILAQPGEENAGILALPQGLACVFKVESHNHPSAIAPYQGAATGVGGIHRDIFTTGAFPIATLNAIHFGLPHEERPRWHLEGVVRGIADYGNSFGIPTVGGQTLFDPVFTETPIVNAMSVGIVPQDRIIRARVHQPGYLVGIAGAPTGKDGLRGAAFASRNLQTDRRQEDLPAVQIGDPFLEKVLLEAILEAHQKGYIVAMQDMGAAGLACSTLEIAARSHLGMDIYLNHVPLRHKKMEPWEILLSESQERMLILIREQDLHNVQKIFTRWETQFTPIGKVTQRPTVRYFWGKTRIAEVPPTALMAGQGAPIYRRPWREPHYQHTIRTFQEQTIPLPNNLKEVAEFLTQHPNLCSREPITRQYDHMIQLGNRSVWFPADSAVIRVPQTQYALALTLDGNPWYVHADPYIGTWITIAEARRNLLCTGAEPLGITNCLNFGNPYDPTVYWQFVNAVQGMGDACRYWHLPVTGGNVSFYNQTEKGPILPLPIIGMVGLIQPITRQKTLAFQNPGDLIYLIGPTSSSLGSSQYLIFYHGIRLSPPPFFDFRIEDRLHQLIQALWKLPGIQSLHDISEGGLWSALLEAAIPLQKGFHIQWEPTIRPDAFLFGEGQSRILVSIQPEAASQLEATCNRYQIPFIHLGTVTSGDIRVQNQNWETIQYWTQLYQSGLKPYLPS